MTATTTDKPGYPDLVVLWDDANIDGVLGDILGARLDRANGLDKGRVPRALSRRPEWGNVRTFLYQAVPPTWRAPWPFANYLLTHEITPVFIEGQRGAEADDRAILDTLDELRSRAADVLLLSHDGGFADLLEGLAQDPKRRVYVAGFEHKFSKAYYRLERQGLIRVLDLEDDLQVFDRPLPRPRVVSLDEFDPASLLDGVPDSAPCQCGDVDWRDYDPNRHKERLPFVRKADPHNDWGKLQGMLHVLNKSDDPALLAYAISEAEHCLEWAPAPEGPWNDMISKIYIRKLLHGSYLEWAKERLGWMTATSLN